MNSWDVLIDTSAWLLFFRPGSYGEPEVADEVERLILAGRACYTEPVYLEIAAGAGSRKDMETLQKHFGVLPLKTVCSPEIWQRAARNLHALARNGFKKKAMDVLIATVAQVYGIALFHHDGDYRTIARVVPFEQYSYLRD